MRGGVGAGQHGRRPRAPTFKKRARWRHGTLRVASRRTRPQLVARGLLGSPTMRLPLGGASWAEAGRWAAQDSGPVDLLSFGLPPWPGGRGAGGEGVWRKLRGTRPWGWGGWAEPCLSLPPPAGRTPRAPHGSPPRVGRAGPLTPKSSETILPRSQKTSAETDSAGIPAPMGVEKKAFPGVPRPLRPGEASGGQT